MLKPCWYLSAASVNSRDWWKGPLSDSSQPKESGAPAVLEVQQQQQQSQRLRAAPSHSRDSRLWLILWQLMLHPATPHPLRTGRRAGGSAHVRNDKVSVRRVRECDTDRESYTEYLHEERFYLSPTLRGHSPNYSLWCAVKKKRTVPIFPGAANKPLQLRAPRRPLSLAPT